MPVKMRQDSIDFYWSVRNVAFIISSEDAIKFYLNSITSKRYVSLEAQQYGLSLSYFLTKQLKASIATLNKINNPQYMNHPIILGLRAKLLIANRENKLADKLYDQAVESYPNHKGLWMGQLEF